MMLCSMRPQKEQFSLPTVLPYQASGTFNRSLYGMAGYTGFRAIIIGAAGGPSGKASGRTINDKDSWLNKAGGGGGGSMIVEGALADLPKITTVLVGSPGSGGANGGNDVKAGDGSDGGDSAFGSGATPFGLHTAFGGKGAIGGKIQIGTAGAINTWNKCKGGAGGTTSNGSGTASAGGESPKLSGSYSGGVIAVGITEVEIAPTSGGSASIPAESMTVGNGGGGSAGAAWAFDGKYGGNPYAAGDGGVPLHETYGSLSVDGNDGACGAGCDTSYFDADLGEDAGVYGSYGIGSNPSGFVALEIL